MRHRAASEKLRRQAFARDRGICAECLADCEKMKRVYWAILDFDAQQFYGRAVAGDGRTFWEADHIQEVAANGSDSLRNIQTLCVACHKKKTAAFMARPQGVKPLYPCALKCMDEDHANAIICFLWREGFEPVLYLDDIDRKGPTTHITLNIARGKHEEFMARVYPGFKAHIKVIAPMFAESNECGARSYDVTC